MSAHTATCPRRGGSRGQALVEFALVIPVFLLMLVGVFDVGRWIYTLNGVSAAASDIARATATSPGNPIGTSQQALDRIAAQRGLVPGMASPLFTCVDLYGTAGTCVSGNYVRVTVAAAFRPVATLGMTGTVTASSTSSVQIP